MSPGQIRPSVRLFAGAMEDKLGKNDHKGGWEDEPYEWFFMKLAEEVGELARLFIDASSHHLSVREHEVWQARVLEEAADAANILHMIADRVGSLKRDG